MKYSFLIVAIFFSLSSNCQDNMSNNELFLRETSTLIKSFNEKKDAEVLRLAYLKLDNVNVYKESNTAKRHQIRAATVILWVKIVNLIDENLPADFDPENTVPMKVQPDPGKDGIGYTPGTDPLSIKDPIERAAYEKKIKDNRKAQALYQLNLQLSHINRPISNAMSRFIVLAYQNNEADQKEIKTVIDTTVKRADRKETLLNILPK